MRTIFTCFGFLFFSNLLLAGDAGFSGSAILRHPQMSEHLGENRESGVSLWDRQYLTGDWEGGRTKLANDGVTISSSYVADVLGNPCGGESRGIAFAGSFGLDINVDIGRHTNLKGLDFYISMAARTGTSLSNKIGNQFSVAQVYGGQNIRLNSLYLKQTFQRLDLVIKVGRMNGGDDFLQSDLYYKYVNNAFDGNPVAIFENGPFTAYPNATWGAYIQFRPYERILAKAAAYVANKEVSENKYHGFNWSFNGTDGAQIITEWSWQVNQLKDETGYPGNYRLGAYYYTGSEGQKYLGGDYHGNWGYYILLDQVIYRPSYASHKQGIIPFAALLFAPEDRNPFPFFIASGLVCEGLIKSRPQDSTNLGFIYGKYSSDQRQAQELARRLKINGPFGNMPQNFEALIELNHWFQVNQWWTFVPDIQYIINPKGFGDIKNAWVVGFQTGVSF